MEPCKNQLLLHVESEDDMAALLTSLAIKVLRDRLWHEARNYNTWGSHKWNDVETQ